MAAPVGGAQIHGISNLLKLTQTDTVVNSVNCTKAAKILRMTACTTMMSTDAAGSQKHLTKMSKASITKYLR
eukprot:11520-Heterococcus_DN1.PRE.1